MTARAGLSFGVGAAALAALPAALRGESALLVWVALVGATAALLGPLLAVARVERPYRPGLVAIALGLGLAAWPTALLLSMLKSATHHRPLGAVTFAFVAGGVLVAAALVALRVLTWLRAPRWSRRERSARWALIGAALLGPAALVWRLGTSAPTRLWLFDATLALGLGAAALLVPWPPRVLRGAERAGPLAWSTCVALGVAAAHGAGARAFEASPALLGAFAWFLR